jgi:hypothetical protein
MTGQTWRVERVEAKLGARQPGFWVLHEHDDGWQEAPDGPVWPSMGAFQEHYDPQDRDFVLVLRRLAPEQEALMLERRQGHERET